MPAQSLPRLPAALLRALTPVAERDELLQDLGGEFGERLERDGNVRATLWIWRQALGSIPALLGRIWWRGRTGFEPHANAFQSGGPSVEQWIMDARFAARRLLRRPLYATLAILTLALGVGGTAAIFGIARAVAFRPLPYREPDRVGLFWAPLGWSQQEFAWLRGRVPGFSEVAQFRFTAMTLEQGSAPARLVPAVAASHEMFSVLGTSPALGRSFESRDDVKGAEPVAVLSHGLWQELGGDRSMIGTRIRLDGLAYTVVGVMPPGFWFPTPAERVWVPQTLDPEDRSGNFALVGRVAPGNTIDNLSGPLSAFTKMLGERFEYPPQWDKTRNPWVHSAEATAIQLLRPAIVATLAAMAMILLIACANVAALMLGQVEGRAVELAVRSALGADRRRLTSQLIAESLLLGVGAGVAGAVVAVGSFRLLVRALPLGAWAETASLDWPVFLVAMTVAVGAALVISLVPVLALWRGRLRGTLVEGRTGGVGGRGVRLESSLVVAEVAIAVLMAAGAGVMARSVSKLYAIDPGVQSRGVGVVDLVLPSDLDTGERMRIFASLIARVRTIPGIQQAGLVQRPPLRGGGWSSGIEVEGKPDLPVTTTYVRFVSPGYLETMGMALVRGRTFAETDLLGGAGDSATGVALINESLAKKYFAQQDPIGRWVSNGFTGSRARVIGIVRDVAEGHLTDEAEPARYLPYTVLPFMAQGQTLTFRTSGDQDPVPLLETVRRTLTEAAPRVAIAQTTTLDQELANAMGPVRQVLTLVSLLTGLALLLGAIGIYGVMSHFVLRRKRDWGIRLALGLRPSRIIASVVGQGSALVALGIACGLISFLFLGRLLRPLIYGIGAADPAAIMVAAAALLLVGLVAALLPAARASRTDPATVLREQ